MYIEDYFMASIEFRKGYLPISSRIFFCASMLLVVCMVLTAQAKSLTSQYNVCDFGASGNGSTLDTKAIQTAIDTCAERGGGMILFPAGKYLTGTINLRNHIRLYLDAGATILGSTNVDDYPIKFCAYPSRSDRYTARALFWGEGLQDIAITGRGTIDGQGAQFKDKRASADEIAHLTKLFDKEGRYVPNNIFANRPFLIRMVSCRDILMENINLHCSAMWMQQYLNCEFLTIRGLSIFNHGCRNNDMMDIDGCRNVVITGCFGDTDDDALTLKSTGEAPTENVTISNCTLSSRCNAIKAGTESSGGFKNIVITNCVIRPSSQHNGQTGRPEGLGGIALEIVDGGTLDGVTISNVTIKETSSPIFLRLGNRARPYKPDMPKPPVGTFRNVVINNIVAQNAGNTGCSIVGIPGHSIENVTISNVKIGFDGGGTKKHVAAEVPELENKYPESTMFGILPAYGFFCRHVDGLAFRDVDFTYDKPEQRPAIVCDDVRNLKLDGFSAQVAMDASGQIIFRNTTDVFITGCRPAASNVFLRLENNSTLINIISNDLSRVKTPFTFDESTSQSDVYVEFNRTRTSTTGNLIGR